MSNVLQAVFTWHNKNNSRYTPPNRRQPFQDLPHNYKRLHGHLSAFQKTDLTAKPLLELLLFLTWRKRKVTRYCLQAGSIKTFLPFQARSFAKVKVAIWLTVTYLARNESPAEPALWPTGLVCHINWHSKLVTQSRFWLSRKPSIVRLVLI